jgi:DNA-directed RNA polymerase specialized sigma24 family protein
LSERNHRDPIPVEHAGHLVAMHALAMLNVLRGYEAARNAGKRDGQRHREALRESMQLTGGRALSWVDLVDLLERLERRNRSDALLVLLKVFNECTDAEIATALGRSLTSIRRDWRSVRAVVRVMLEESRSP